MRVLALVGPTASGKTEMAVELIRELEGHALEVVSCDSMGIYKGLNILAAKPTLVERGGVPHHLFDVVDPSQSFTAVEYRKLARKAFEEIDSRGAVPFLVGGSGLYFRAAVDELSFAPTDASVRARVMDESPEELHRRLAEADPQSAERIDPRNIRRLVRAVEILELTGRPPTELRKEWDSFEGPYELTVAGLTWDREVLRSRVDSRVHGMVAKGLVEEVRSLQGLSDTALQALGVKEMAEHIEGRMGLEEATQALARNTKRFVRRQLGWFEGDPRVQWVNCSELGWGGARERLVGLFRGALEPDALE
jgi:tRNA dimethylallyltransferase